MADDDARITQRSLRAVRGGNLKLAVRLILDAQSSGRLEIYDQLFHPDFVSRSPARPQMSGVEAYKALIVRHRAALRDFEVEVQELVQEGSTVVARWTTRGIHEGDFFGIPPTGRKVEWSGMTVFRFEDDRLIEQWVQSDGLALLRQMGALDEPMRSIK